MTELPCTCPLASCARCLKPSTTATGARTTEERHNLEVQIRASEARDRALHGELATARGRVGQIERAIVDHERSTNALKKRLAELSK